MFGGVFMLLLIVCCLGILAYLITQVLWEMKLQYHADHYEIAVNNKEHTKTVYVKVKRETYLICDIILTCAFVFCYFSKNLAMAGEQVYHEFVFFSVSAVLLPALFYL